MNGISIRICTKTEQFVDVDGVYLGSEKRHLVVVVIAKANQRHNVCFLSSGWPKEKASQKQFFFSFLVVFFCIEMT